MSFSHPEYLQDLPDSVVADIVGINVVAPTMVRACGVVWCVWGVHVRRGCCGAGVEGLVVWLCVEERGTLPVRTTLHLRCEAFSLHACTLPIHTHPRTTSAAAVQAGASGDEGARARRDHQHRQRRRHRHPDLAAADGWVGGWAGVAWQPGPFDCASGADSPWLCSGAVLAAAPHAPCPPNCRLTATHLLPTCRLPCLPSPLPSLRLAQCTRAPRPTSTASRARSTPSAGGWGCGCRTRRPCLWPPRCRRSSERCVGACCAALCCAALCCIFSGESGWMNGLTGRW